MQEISQHNNAAQTKYELKRTNQKKRRKIIWIPWSSSQREMLEQVASGVELPQLHQHPLDFVGVRIIMQMYLTTSKPCDHCCLGSGINKDKSLHY